MLGQSRETSLQRELRVIAELEEWTRAELYAVRPARWRADAATAVAASAAERTYRLLEPLPQWQNDTSATWRASLGHVWELLAGDPSQHDALSRAVAGFLVSPLNHLQGQDGPDDFDRPQTVAAYSAALSAVVGGVDFATTAIRQPFEAIDLLHDGDDAVTERWAEVQRELASARRIVTAVVAAARDPQPGFTPALLDSLKT